MLNSMSGIGILSPFALCYPWLYENIEEGSNPGEMHIDVSSGVNSGTATSGLRLH